MTHLEKQQLLEEAQKRFPIGCKFNPVLESGRVLSTIYTQKQDCHFFKTGNELWIMGSANIRNYKGDWAEIVSYPEGYITEPNNNLILAL
jgi:hypothetical protein